MDNKKAALIALGIICSTSFAYTYNYSYNATRVRQLTDELIELEERVKDVQATCYEYEKEIIKLHKKLKESKYITRNDGK